MKHTNKNKSKHKGLPLPNELDWLKIASLKSTLVKYKRRSVSPSSADVIEAVYKSNKLKPMFMMYKIKNGVLPANVDFKNFSTMNGAKKEMSTLLVEMMNMRCKVDKPSKGGVSTR